MIEKSIRKYHGRIGVLLSIFIFIQVGSGTIIALNTIIEQRPHAHEEYSNVDVHEKSDSDANSTNETGLIETIHHHGETISQIFRVAVGVGILMMAISGVTIYILTLKRKKNAV